jgi:hypothetical protein
MFCLISTHYDTQVNSLKLWVLINWEKAKKNISAAWKDFKLIQSKTGRKINQEPW